jgi:hypothetical protein
MAGVIAAVVATAVTTTLTAPLFIALDDLKQVTKHQAEAIEALSRGLSQLTQIVHHLQLEIESIKNVQLQKVTHMYRKSMQVNFLYSYPYLNEQKPLVFPIITYTLSTTKLEIRAK